MLKLILNTLGLGENQIHITLHINDITFIPAVIGGGIGGTSLSHFLKKSMPEASVHLYEKGKVYEDSKLFL